jgi:septal ring factor EnvC (AmiA/AmiB activator)
MVLLWKQNDLKGIIINKIIIAFMLLSSVLFAEATPVEKEFKKEFKKLEVSIVKAIRLLKIVTKDNKELKKELKQTNSRLSETEKKFKKLSEYVGLHYIREPIKVSSEIETLEKYTGVKKDKNIAKPLDMAKPIEITEDVKKLNEYLMDTDNK